jgi:hypothetical protein
MALYAWIRGSSLIALRMSTIKESRRRFMIWGVMNSNRYVFGIMRRIESFVSSIKTWDRLKIEKVCDSIFVTRRLREKRNQKIIMKASSENKLLNFDEKVAFGRFEIGNDDYLEKLYILANIQKNRAQLGQLKKLNSKEYLQSIFDLSMVDKETIFMIDGILSAEFIASVTKYFDGKVPILHNVSIFYSPPSMKSDQYEGSQLWHRDGDGTKNLKVWVLCEDTSEEDGPTILLDGKSSERIARDINYIPGKKIPDILIESSSPYRTAKQFKGTGKKGQAFYTDTCRSFHYGSRTSKETSRLVAMYHFVDNNSNYWLPFITKIYRAKMRPLSQDLKNIAMQNDSLRIILEKRLSIN